jgi:nickel-type superoxide dismutase maturation protease
LARLRGLPRRVTVAGDSMLPSFRAGDRLLVVPTRNLSAGQVVALRDPTAPDRLLVKRVREVAGDGLDVRGDNEQASTDSRTFGAVPSTMVIGRVVYRYHPPERAGLVAAQAHSPEAASPEGSSRPCRPPGAPPTPPT